MSLTRLLHVNHETPVAPKERSTERELGSLSPKLGITMGKMGIKRHVFEKLESQNVFHLSHIFIIRQYLCFI